MSETFEPRTPELSEETRQAVSLLDANRRIAALEAARADLEAASADLIVQRDEALISESKAITELAQVKAERDAAVADAERYRWLKPLLDSADFAYGDPPRSVIVFAWDRPVSANLDAMLDAALAARKEEA